MIVREEKNMFWQEWEWWLWLRYYLCPGNSWRQNCCIPHFVNQQHQSHNKTHQDRKYRSFVSGLSQFFVMTHYFCDQDMISWYHAHCSHVSESAGLEDILSEFADTPVLDNAPLCVTYRTHHTSHVAKLLHDSILYRYINWSNLSPWNGKLQFYHIYRLIGVRILGIVTQWILLDTKIWLATMTTWNKREPWAARPGPVSLTSVFRAQSYSQTS